MPFWDYFHGQTKRWGSLNDGKDVHGKGARARINQEIIPKADSGKSAR